MKKALIAVLLVLLTLGLFVSCNGEVDEKVFTNSYKIQSDGTWKMGGKVYGPSTKPYILVLPKSLNIEKDVQLADLQKGLISLDEFVLDDPKSLGTAKITLTEEDTADGKILLYKYENKESDAEAQNIFMRTHDDFSETIQLNAPHDEFSHYGSLNFATVEDIASDSYYEYGYLRQIVLKKGHVVVKKQAEVGTIIVEAASYEDVTIDIETEEVNAVLVPDKTANDWKNVVKTGNTKVGNTTDKYVDEEGKFYDNFSNITGDNKIVKLLQDEESDITTDTETKYSGTLDLCGNTVKGNVTVETDSTLTIKDSVGIGKVEGTLSKTGTGTLKIEGGNYKNNPSGFIDKKNYESKKVEDYYKVAKKAAEKPPVNPSKAPDALCFTAVEANATVKLIKKGSPTDITLEYSTDGSVWTDYIVGETGNITLASVGDKVYFRAGEGGNDHFSKDKNNYYYFALGDGNKKVEASGSVLSLLNSSQELLDISNAKFNYCFAYLFNGCAKLVTAPELPATTLSSNCYFHMFDGCTGLTTAPALPAQTLAESCYSYMFLNCTSLTTAPALPAATLALQCYYHMFDTCTGLTTAPALPAQTLAKNCYAYMFFGCRALTTAPVLPAQTLAENCYEGMFKDCSSLTTAPALPAQTLATWCYSSMFQGCSSLTTAPALPAQTLAENCYSYMFADCTSLNYISVSFKQWNDGVSATNNWVRSVAATGTFKCPAELTGTVNDSHVPTGWTIKSSPKQIISFAAQDKIEFKVKDAAYAGIGSYTQRLISVDGIVVTSALNSDFNLDSRNSTISFKYSVSKATEKRSGYVKVTFKNNGSTIFEEEFIVIQNPSVTITFNLGGHGGTKSVEIPEGTKVTLPQEYYYEDGGSYYRVKKWYQDVGLTNEWNFDTTVTTDTTLYAEWDEGNKATISTILNTVSGGFPTKDQTSLHWTGPSFCYTREYNSEQWLTFGDPQDNCIETKTAYPVTPIDGTNQWKYYDGTNIFEFNMVNGQCVSIKLTSSDVNKNSILGGTYTPR